MGFGKEKMLLRVFDLLMIQTDISISSNKGVKKDTNATSKVVWLHCGPRSKAYYLHFAEIYRRNVYLKITFMMYEFYWHIRQNFGKKNPQEETFQVASLY